MPGSTSAPCALLVSTHSAIAALAASVLLAGASSPTEAAGLPEQLAALIDLPCLRSAEVGIKVTRLRDGQVLFERGSEEALKPASTLKLITGAAALSILGPEHTFKTRFLADGPLEDGVLRGNLVVIGGGAPDLTAERLWYAARSLARLGLREVRGDLVGDDSYFDSQRRPRGWPVASNDRAYNAPVGALSYNFNVVSIEVRPAAEVGQPPSARLSPLGAGLELTNTATTSASRSDLRVGVRRHQGRDLMLLRGAIRRGSPPLVLHRSIEDPTLYTLGALRELLAREGIAVRGALKSATAPEGAHELYTLESQPLSQLLLMMNKKSNNMMAETLLKAMGAQESGPPGTSAAGLRAVRRARREIGVDTGGMRLGDASGLSHETHLPTSVLVRVLEEMPRRFAAWPEFLASLPIGGVDGTLDDRMSGDLARRVRAKTGRIHGVVSLAGYASNGDGDLLAFAVLVNRVRCGFPRVVEQVDRLALAIAGSRSDGTPSRAAAAAARPAPPDSPQPASPSPPAGIDAGDDPEAEPPEGGP
jgi:D-alanyl-D-alanine carboxypeptidase/D-alanyl-D-alanine-endopeptidase (penicillin-binding protein 4)